MRARKTAAPFNQAVKRVTAALEAEGFSARVSPSLHPRSGSV
jgi:hypothetical protein